MPTQDEYLEYLIQYKVSANRTLRACKRYIEHLEGFIAKRYPRAKDIFETKIDWSFLED